MPVDHPFNVYDLELSSKYHGTALWRPNPVGGLYDHCGHVSIGDVGYLYEGTFVRMFNVTLPWNDESNKTLGEPYRYDPLVLGNLAIRREAFGKVDYYSRRVYREEDAEDVERVMYWCQGRGGAILSLPHGGHREDSIHIILFEKFIRDHVVTWFNWSRDKGLPIKRMEDLVLVYGCTLVTSWAAAAFDDHAADAQVSLMSSTLDNGRAIYHWRNIRGNVEYHHSHFDPNDKHPLPQNQCVFIRGCRAKPTSFLTKYLRAAVDSFSDDHNNRRERTFFRTKPLRAAAEPFPVGPNNRRERTFFQTKYLRAAAEPPPDDSDDPENRRKSGIQGNIVPNVPNYSDPLGGVLDNIAEESLEDPNTGGDTAIVHVDNLQFVESKDLETLTVDVAEFRESETPGLTESGGIYPIPMQRMRERLSTDFDSLNGNYMRKWSQDNLVSQEQAPDMKGLLACPSASTIFLNEDRCSFIENGVTPTRVPSQDSTFSQGDGGGYLPSLPGGEVLASQHLHRSKMPSRQYLSSERGFPNLNRSPLIDTMSFLQGARSHPSGRMTRTVSAPLPGDGRPPAGIQVESPPAPKTSQMRAEPEDRPRFSSTLQSLLSNNLSTEKSPIPSSQPLSQLTLERPPVSSLPPCRIRSRTATEPESTHRSGMIPESRIRAPTMSYPRRRSLNSTVMQALTDHPAFRILVVGKRSSRNSMLINAFRVDTSATQAIAPDINFAFRPDDNHCLIVHECSGLEPGDAQGLQAIRDFISNRTDPGRIPSERLHAIWICVPTSDAINRSIGEGVEEILSMRRVPVFVEFTQSDITYPQITGSESGNFQYQALTRSRAYAQREQLCLPLFYRGPRDVPAELVSVIPQFRGLINNLIVTTDRFITGSRTASNPSSRSSSQGAKPRVAAAPLAWSVALRASRDTAIQASIEIGRSRYWRSLWSSLDFADLPLKSCVNVIHIDIVEKWNLYELNEYLSSNQFKIIMSHVIKGLAVPAGGLSRSPEWDVPGDKFADWVHDVYRGSQENVRCVMGYIVNLTVILNDIFRIGSSNLTDIVALKATNTHIRSGRRDNIHRDIRSFVTETFAIRFAVPQRDLVLEKIIELIRQYCAPPPPLRK